SISSYGISLNQVLRYVIENSEFLTPSVDYFIDDIENRKDEITKAEYKHVKHFTAECEECCKLFKNVVEESTHLEDFADEGDGWGPMNFDTPNDFTLEHF